MAHFNFLVADLIPDNCLRWLDLIISTERNNTSVNNGLFACNYLTTCNLKRAFNIYNK